MSNALSLQEIISQFKLHDFKCKSCNTVISDFESNMVTSWCKCDTLYIFRFTKEIIITLDKGYIKYNLKNNEVYYTDIYRNASIFKIKYPLKKIFNYSLEDIQKYVNIS